MSRRVEGLENEIRAAAVPVAGEPVTLERLTGVGGPGVVRVSGARGQVIVKYPVRQEATFYRSWAPLVREQGLGVPQVYAQGEKTGQAWIVMEALESTLGPPYRERLADMVAYLAQLHTLQWNPSTPAGDDPLPVRAVFLSSRDVEDAATLWPAGVRATLVHLLHLPWPTLPDETRLVSGDPNPTNWGLRASGQLVLFDWSEVAWSHPAYDLAVLCGGLPQVDLVREVVEAYLKAAPGQADSSDRWVAWVITARLVAFVWFAAWWTRGQLTEAARPGLTMLQDGLVDWIGAVRPAVTAFLP